VTLGIPLERLSIFTIVALAAASLSGLLFAGSAAAQSVAERRETLAQITEKLNDPDPFMRLAYMEEIIAADRALDSQIAIKMALSSEDSDLRSVALRAYMVTTRGLRFEILLPERIVDEYEATKGDEKKQAKVSKKWRTVLFYYNGLSRRLNIVIEDANLATGRFSVYSKNNLTTNDDRYAGEGSVVGGRISLDVNVYAGGQKRACSIEVSPDTDLMLRGELSCALSLLPLPVKMRMY